jgi:hypothetical protein
MLVVTRSLHVFPSILLFGCEDQLGNNIRVGSLDDLPMADSLADISSHTTACIEPTLCDDVLIEVFKLLGNREQVRILQLVLYNISSLRNFSCKS